MSTETDTPWARIVAGAADALIYADTGGAIRAWNGAAEALFGFSAAEALGQSLDLRSSPSACAPPTGPPTTAPWPAPRRAWARRCAPRAPRTRTRAASCTWT
ncbi:PAS domain-containing protein [Ottowia sp.]|uniref:PAS domain-containing protein n=1 Tax=Ottowia sp. TaxID=1898956 RepID=UPI0039E2AB61